MSVHIEWSEASYAERHVSVARPLEITDAWGNTNELPALCVDLDGGSVTVFEGGKAELLSMVDRWRTAILELPDDL